MKENNSEDINDLITEYCPFCESEVVIPSKGVTACPECGKSLVPCSQCEFCNYETCPYGCTGGFEDQFIPVTNREVLK